MNLKEIYTETNGKRHEIKQDTATKKYFNFYEVEHDKNGRTLAQFASGLFNTLEQARREMKKHRPNAKKIDKDILKFKNFCKKHNLKEGTAEALTKYRTTQENAQKHYKRAKAKAQAEAVEISHKINLCCMSWGEILETQTKFEKLGKKYGLLKEFRINGIC